MNTKMNYFKSGVAVALLAGSGLAADGIAPVSAGTDSASLDYLTRRVNSVMSKAGIQFNGEFESRGVRSVLKGNLDTKSELANKKSEDLMYTALDLGLTMGPHSALQGKTILRFHEDWRNMFASYATPITMRWMAANGNVKDVFFYSVGDFKEKFTPLTVWTAEPELMYEPYIFARQRQQVMDEVFAGDNNRVLQGANVAFHGKISPVFEELSAKGYFTRLRKMGKSEDNTRPEALDTKDVLMDRYSAGANLFMKFRPDAEFGGSFVYTGDAFNTHKSGSAVENRANQDQNMIFGANGAFGTGVFSGIDSSRLNIRLDLEGAVSTFKTWKVTGKGDTATAADTTRIGLATNATISAKVGLGEIGKLNGNVGIVFNDTGFVNEMAQSPIFYGRQILNTSVKGAYNSFDGLYKSVFRYTPATGELSIKEPQSKISWTRGVLTADELGLLVTNSENGILDSKKAIAPSADKVVLDRSFSPIMYLGDATPNRVGVEGKLGGEFVDKAILVSTLFNMYQSFKATTLGTGKDLYKMNFMQFGGGASLDVAKFGSWWSYPLVLSGSFVHSESKVKTTVAADKIDLINSSLYWKFWKRAALMGGAQFIKRNGVDIDGDVTYFSNESNIAGGLEYSVTDGGTLSATVGNVKLTDKNLDVNNFSTMQYDLLLTVKF